MKIKDIKSKEVSIPLLKPFVIALGARYEYTGVVVKIETDEEIFGIGEASPSARITGETTQTVVDVIENQIKPAIIGENPLDIEKIMDKVDSTILGNTSAKCAIDTALHDILGKYVHLPLKALLGGSYREEINTSITIGIKSIEETLKEGREMVKSGVKIIKVKLGLNPKEDIEKIKRLREEVGYDITIRVDGNQGYEVREAIEVLKKIAPYKIEFIEQPVKFWDIQGMKRVREASDIPVMADESVHSPQDAINFVRAEACDLINIKLMKAGGVRNAVKIANIAEGAGIKCMIGGMTETKIGMTAATHVAAAIKNIKYADLDGHVGLKENITIGGVVTEGSKNRISDKEGLGLELKPGVL
ncbi:MAG TPA: dipeptide epimerase [bacterium (Candidatus Stahlbacteria)]|nr:dipeptide epimerase [Candidatus Stahlbacteria bacterium]